MRPFHILSVIAALLLGAVLLGLAATLRDPQYDEGYTAFVTGTAPRPAWPTTPFRAGDMRGAFAPAPTPWQIAGNLRRTDVHPPLYFWTVWAWRRVFGPSLLVSRLLSVAFSLGALTALAAIARRAAFPVLTSFALTLGAYGFVETGIVTRGFALAQCLMLCGLLLTLEAGSERSRPRLHPLAAGLLLGAASFSNYLTAFTAVAALLWLAPRSVRRALWLLAGLLPFIAGDLFFFLAQRESRVGQFPPFSLSGMATALAHAIGGALLGGLPLYVPPGADRHLLTGVLGAVLAIMLLLPCLLWQRRESWPATLLLAMAAAAPLAGLCLMGLATDTIPVEIRYLCFSIPPFALLMAAALAQIPRPARLCGLAGIVTVQTCAIIGLLTRTETMQPEGAAARAAWAQVGAQGIVLLPRGNDGVGIVSAFLTAAPDDLHILLVTPKTTLSEVLNLLTEQHCHRLATAMIAADQNSRATWPLLGAVQKITAKCVDASASRLLPSFVKV